VARSKLEHGRYILLIKYRVSQTHRGAAQYKEFRSTDARWRAGGRSPSWPTAEEAMTHAQPFTQFVQRGFAGGLGGSSSSINASTPPSFAAASASPSRRSKRTAEQSAERPSADDSESDHELSLDGVHLDFTQAPTPGVNMLHVVAADEGGGVSVRVRLCVGKTDAQLMVHQRRLEAWNSQNSNWVARQTAAVANQRYVPKRRASQRAADARASSSPSASTVPARPQAAAFLRRKRLGWGQGAKGRQSRSQLVRNVVARVEASVQRIRQQQAYQSAWRRAQIKLLQEAIARGNCAGLLVAPEEGEPAHVSKKQAVRVDIQCITLVEFFTLLEEEAARHDGLLPARLVYPLADQAGASVERFTGVSWSGRTVRDWYYAWHSNESRLLRDRRGRYEREVIVLEEDLCRKLRRWGRHHQNAPQFIDKAAAFINGTLLKEVAPEMLVEFRISLPVARSTVARWLSAVNIKRQWAKQNYFNDTHQNALIIKQRGEYIVQREAFELRQPLWVHLSATQRSELERRGRLSAADAIAKVRVKAEAKGLPAELPATLTLPTPRHEWDEGGVTMYEYHVDDAECFLEHRAARPLGGDFSRRWSGRPLLPPSTPPAREELMAVGATLSGVEEEAGGATGGTAAGGEAGGEAGGSGAADGGAGGGAAETSAQPPAPPPCAFTRAEIKKLSPAELNEELSRLGVAPPTHGSGAKGNVVKADLVTCLCDHVFEQQMDAATAAAAATARAEAEEEGSASGDEGATATIDAIIGMRTHAVDGYIEFHVRWVEPPADAAPDSTEQDETWEAEWQLEGAEEAIWSYLNSVPPLPHCRHHHHPSVCKCHLPLWHLGQDEKIWKAYQMARGTWAVNGVTGLRKKCDGPGSMGSGVQVRCRNLDHLPFGWSNVYRYPHVPRLLTSG